MNNVLFKSIMSFCALTATTSVVSADYYHDNASQCEPCWDLKNFNFYVGGNVGVASRTTHLNDHDGFLTDNSGWSILGTGALGGGQIGFDWTKGTTLVGLVADWNGVSIRSDLNDNPNVVDSDNLARNEFSSLATVRARLGLTVCDTLVYITAGGARAKFKTRWRDAPADFRDNYSKWGWTGGAGTSFDLGCNLSLGAEVLYAHFDDKVRTFEDPIDPATLYSFGNSNSIWTARVTLNYNFGNFSRFLCW